MKSFQIHKYFSRVTMLGAVAAIAGMLPGHGQQRAGRINQQTLVPFMKNYCIQCHNNEEQRGDVNFRDYDWNVSDELTAQHWQDVLDVLNSGEMPPDDEKQPDDQELRKVVESLTTDLAAARSILKDAGGAYTMRRLNKREYINTIKHLTGVQIAESFVPDDIRDEHYFDTAEGLQYLDGPLLTQHIQMGSEIAAQGIKWSAQPLGKPKTHRHEAEVAYKKFEKGSVKGYPVDDEGLYMCKGGPPYRAVRSISINHGNDPRAYYKLRVRGAAHDMDAPQRHFLMVQEESVIRGQDTPILEVVKVGGTRENPSVTEVTIPRTTLGTNPRPSLTLSEVMFEGITNIGRWFPIYLRKIGSEESRPSVWVDWVELEGPFYDQQTNPLGELLKKHKGDDNVEKLLEGFATEAFRGIEPSRDYIKKLERFFQDRRKSGADYNQALSETLGLILASPGFLYLEEGSKGGKLDGRSMANRLAYFLWSSPPDAQLSAVADQLSNPAELRKQVNRMVTDPRADAFYDGFMSQWAETWRLDQISPEWEKFTKFNKGIRYSIAQEPVAFFRTLVQENLGAYYLIDSTFVTVNSQLAHFYGLEEHGSSDFLKVPIPADHPRGGLLTQAAFLTMGSVGDRTSPVIRGSLILEKLLNDPPPPPPPNVPELGDASDKPLTNRELVELHRKEKVCASCHDKIDPIGYSLENFDAVGLWRESEKVGARDVPVDTTARLHDGKRLGTLRDLQVYIKGKEDQLSRQVLEALLSYGIGRNVQFSDAPEIDKIHQKVAGDNIGMQDLIFHAVDSEVFRGK